MGVMGAVSVVGTGESGSPIAGLLGGWIGSGVADL